jgi:nucleoside-diphosphate-sugar epimerase
VKALLAAGASVLVVDSMTAGYRWNLPRDHQLLVIEGELLDETVLKRAFAERPSIVFHLAAFFANQNSVDYPERDLLVNGMGTLRMLEYATLVGVDRFVYTSSSSVYGTDPPLPVNESHVSLNLSTPYQITKLLGEMYGTFYLKHHGLPVSTVRLFNSFGPGEVPGQYRNVIPNFLYWALTGQPIPITGTGEETRDFTYVDDVVDGYLACGHLEEAIGQVFNLAGGRQVPIREVAARILELSGSSSEIVHLPARTWDTKKRFEADTSMSL